MEHSKPTLFERGMVAFIAAWQRRREPASGWQRMKRGFHWLLVGANVLYLASLLSLWALTGWVGERHYLTAFCLFVPPQAWLLPLLLLTPLTWLAARPWLWLHLPAVLWVAFGFFDFHWHSPQPASNPVLRVMTNNYGQNNRQSFTAFLQQEQPDVIALQEAVGQAGRLTRAYTNYQGRAYGEFVLLSRHPILNAGPVPVYDPFGWPIGAWFELNVHSRTVVVYNVHLPSPRRELYRLRGLGLLVALAGETAGEGRSVQFQEDVAKAWRQRLDMAQRLMVHLEKEKRPFVLAGDFNMPSRGWLHRQFRARYTDAFAEAGRGYGLTFPGYSSNPLTGFGPWLRLDYIFCGGDFRPVQCVTERGRRSQHRAVAAQLEWAH
ncbi:MAG: endonuclease/exonuclease/phosphatase family protein [Verrucomicrobiae bacterium]|nr:endonuclease/exonuclease/phosphatase family protein [Verrucomicrobiae bacterium]